MIYQNLEFFNAAEMRPAEDGKGGMEPYRCPAKVQEQLNPTAQNFVASTVGSEIRFVIEDDGEAKLTFDLVLYFINYRCEKKQEAVK